MAFWSRILPFLGAGAAAASARKAVDPVVEVIGQDAWKANPFRVLDLFSLAGLVAQGLVDPVAARDHAARNGYDANKLDAAVQLELKGPPVAEALELWRRGRLTQAQVVHALHKAQIEPQYHTAILDLFQERLDPAVVATAIQRGIMTDPGILPVGPPTATGKVKKFPVSPLDPVAEAQATGIDLQRLFVETAIVGLPASPDLAARMTYRGIIDPVDFDRAIAEGNTRNEWAAALFEGFRQIPTPHDYAEARLRGWITDPEMYAGTARHGMTHADTDLIEKVIGRPIPEHQVVTGEARGGVYNGPTSHIPTPFLKSLQESNIRPEWYNLAYANKFSYSVPFWLRALMTAGVYTTTQAEQILLELGNRPDIALAVAQHFTGGTGTTTGPHVKKAQTQLWSATHKSYIENEITASQAQAELAALGVTAAEQTAVLALWGREQAMIRRTLSAKEIKKAWTSLALNPATGLAWTQAEAHARLVQLGYNAADATTFLEE